MLEDIKNMFGKEKDIILMVEKTEHGLYTRLNADTLNRLDKSQKAQLISFMNSLIDKFEDGATKRK